MKTLVSSNKEGWYAIDDEYNVHGYSNISPSNAYVEAKANGFGEPILVYVPKKDAAFIPYFEMTQ